jgi:hypothetical protein
MARGTSSNRTPSRLNASPRVTPLTTTSSTSSTSPSINLEPYRHRISTQQTCHPWSAGNCSERTVSLACLAGERLRSLGAVAPGGDPAPQDPQPDSSTGEALRLYCCPLSICSTRRGRRTGRRTYGVFTKARSRSVSVMIPTSPSTSTTAKAPIRRSSINCAASLACWRGPMVTTFFVIADATVMRASR